MRGFGSKVKEQRRGLSNWSGFLFGESASVITGLLAVRTTLRVLVQGPY